MTQTKEQKRASAKTYYWQLKSKAIDALGGGCEECGFSDKRALRIFGKKRMSVSLFKSIIEGEMSGYKVLCTNCYIIETKDFPLILPREIKGDVGI